MRRRLCVPALSLPSLLQTAGGSLTAVPGYFQRSVLTSNHRYALLAFGIRLMPLSRQRQVIERMRAALTRQPASEPSSPVCRCWPQTPRARSPPGRNRVLMLVLSLVFVAVGAAGHAQARRAACSCR